MSNNDDDRKSSNTVGNSSSSTTSSSGPGRWNDTKSWEDSPLFFWMGLDIWKNPANVLLVSSIPFFAGAYLGFKKPTEKLEELVGTAGDGNNKNGGGDGVPTPERRRLGLRMASRALRLATMGTVGGFGILGAFGFYASGYESIDECIQSTTSWATRLRQSFEDWIGMEDRPSKTHPEVLATNHMNEDEVLNYVYETYIKEPDEEENNNNNNENIIRTNNEQNDVTSNQQ